MIKGLLIDLDGVMYNDTRPIPGAAETIDYLQQREIPFRFITNTTMKSKETLARKLNSMGIHTDAQHIFSAASAAAEYLRKQSENKSLLLLQEDAKREYNGIPQDDHDVDFVVVGDMGDDFSIPLLNRAFNCLMQGARLIALQKNRFWLSDQGYRMDAGAFVALLEYAADTKAILIGKPSAQFYELALSALGCTAPETLMVGDDMESDIAGAKKMGIQTCLVKTGKFREVDLQKSPVKPDWMIVSIAQLPDLLQQIKEK